MRFLIAEEAEADIADAFERYEASQPGVGSKFLDEVAAAFHAVQFEPLRFPNVHRSVRRALMHRFPFGVYFVARVDEITIVAVMHMARRQRHTK